MSTIVLSANDAPEGKEFDQWAVYTETGDEIINYRTNTEDPKQISFDMSNAEVYAKKTTKAGKPAKVTLSCGRGKFVLNVIVK